MPTPPLTIQLLGPLRIRIQGEPMPRGRTRSVEWLLALLVLRHGRSLERSWLAGTLWPDSLESQALHNLRDILVQLRKALGSESGRIQSPTRDTLTLDLEGAEVDLIRFDRALQTGEEEVLRSAVEVYAGPLLEGCQEEWVLLERNHREQACLRALEMLAEASEHRQEYAKALAYLNRAKGMDPLRDTTRRGLMRVLAASGDTPAALASYREYRLLLHEEMSVDPDAETVRLYEQIREQARQAAQHKTPTREEAQSAPATSPATPALPSTLPNPLTPLIGREQETHEIAEALSRSRLVTLVGGGGVGKTRLAIEVGRERATRSTQEVAFLALASLSDPALLPSFFAMALGIREKASQDPEFLLQALVGWLNTHNILLVLDNCEHLVEAAASLTQTLLERCPELRVLATSRQRLGLMGEIVWRVPSLPVPEVEQLPAALEDARAVALTFPAIQLFVERAASVQQEFRLTRREELEAVCRICHRLDGIPLAIELAAARVCSLSAEAIHARLDQRFRLLTGGSPAALPRQQTLRSLIDWSYDLLGEEEKALLYRLSVFSGGWTLEAAEAICADTGKRSSHPLGPSTPRTSGGAETTAGVGTLGRRKSGDDSLSSFLPSLPLLEEWEILDLLTGLIDKSLVAAEPSGTSLRYRLLESIRQYAGERLEASGEAGRWRSQHRDFFLALAEQAAPNLTGAEQRVWLQRLEAEHENLRSGLEWSLLEEGSAGGLRLCGALQTFWWTRGHLSEGREWCERALGKVGAEEKTKERTSALNGAGALAQLQGDYASAIAYHEESLSIRREIGDRSGIAASLCNLGLVAYHQGDYASARSYYEESVSLFREIGDRSGIADVLNGLGCVAFFQADYASARAYYEENLSLFREIGDSRGIAGSLVNLGTVAHSQSDFDAAQAYYEESLAHFREIGDRRGIAVSLLNLGAVAYDQGKYASARAYYEENLPLFREIGDRSGIADVLNGLGYVAFRQGDYASARLYHEESMSLKREIGDSRGIASSLEAFADLMAAQEQTQQAARLWGAAERLREEIGAPLSPNVKEKLDRKVAELRQTLGEAVFTAAWGSGRTMPLEQALLYAREATV